MYLLLLADCLIGPTKCCRSRGGDQRKWTAGLQLVCVRRGLDHPLDFASLSLMPDTLRLTQACLAYAEHLATVAGSHDQALLAYRS